MTSSERRGTTRLCRRTYLAAVGTGVLGGMTGCDEGILREGPDSTSGDGGVVNDPWSQVVRLTPDGERPSNFGYSVALSGDTALVSVGHVSVFDGEVAGAAYVFERTDGTWTQQAELVADEDDGDGYFGGEGGSAALSSDGTTALVGSERDDDSGAEAGSAYVFERTDGTWTRQAKLAPDDGDRKDFFGKAVAVADDTAVVGAARDEDPNGDQAGSAYVFERTDGTWRQRAKLAPDDGDDGDLFGWSVLVEGDTAVIGAPRCGDPGGAHTGSAYAFQRTAGTWRQRARLAPEDGDAGDFFGGSVARAGDTVLVGAPEDDDPNGERAGSAYVFQRTAGTWSQRAKLLPDDGDSIDLFGASVALSDDATTALVGARVDEDPNGEQAGSAYVFEQTEGTWSQRVKLAPDDGSHVFGRSVAQAGDAALIGTAAGEAYVFVESGDG